MNLRISKWILFFIHMNKNIFWARQINVKNIPFFLKAFRKKKKLFWKLDILSAIILSLNVTYASCMFDATYFLSSIFLGFYLLSFSIHITCAIYLFYFLNFNVKRIGGIYWSLQLFFLFFPCIFEDWLLLVTQILFFYIDFLKNVLKFQLCI